MFLLNLGKQLSFAVSNLIHSNCSENAKKCIILLHFINACIKQIHTFFVCNLTLQYAHLTICQVLKTCTW